MSPLFAVLALLLVLSITVMAVSGARGRTRLALGSAAAMLVLAVGGYVVLGSPDLTRPGADSPEALLARAVARLDEQAAILRRSGTATIKDWTDLAGSYWQAGKMLKSAEALGAAAALARGDQRDALLGAQGQALVSANGKRVSPKARALFADVLSRHPDDLRALFFLGLAAEQAGDKAANTQYWGHLLAIAPDNAAWRKALEGRMQAIGKTPAQTPEQNKVAALPEGPQRRMIEGMVARLAKRLHDKGGSASDWARLGRSYAVLERWPDAAAAYGEAEKLAPGDAAIAAAAKQARERARAAPPG